MTERPREDPLEKAAADSGSQGAESSRGSGRSTERRAKGRTKGGKGGANKSSRSKKRGDKKASDSGKAKAAEDRAQLPSQKQPADEPAARSDASEPDGDAKEAAGEQADPEAADVPAIIRVEAGSDPGDDAAEEQDGEDQPASTSAKRAGPIEIRVFGRTDVGQIREHNEDNLLIADLTSKIRGVGSSLQSMRVRRGGVLMAVCDGMGGAAAGEVASQMATDVIYERMLSRAGHSDRDKLALDIVEALEHAGARILHEANENRACRGMGTTATVAALVDDALLMGQVGDSRAYLLRGDRLVQVTRDQSLVNQLIEAGQLTEEEAENFEHSNIILQALGTAEAVQVDLTYAELRRGDVLLLCSDGLSGMIRDSEIAETLTNVPDPVEACRVLIDDANQAGGHDNITVIVAVFDGEGLPEATLEDVENLKYQKYAVPAYLGHRPAAGFKRGSFDDEDTYDDTPLIEITGEFEVDPNTDWADLLDERPRIPTEQGPDLTSVMVWVGLIALVVLAYFLFIAP